MARLAYGAATARVRPAEEAVDVPWRRRAALAIALSLVLVVGLGAASRARAPAAPLAAMRAARVRTVVWSTWDGGLAEARVETFEGYQSTNIFTHA